MTASRVQAEAEEQRRADRIAAYWKARGHAVRVRVDPCLPTGPNGGPVFSLRSDMLNGLPPTAVRRRPAPVAPVTFKTNRRKFDG